MFRRSSQQQSAGDNAQQLQINIDARQVVEEQIRETTKRYGAQGARIADERMVALGTKLLGILAEEDLLPAFGNPAFQNSSKAAFDAASAISNDLTHDRLARLLARRAAEGDEPTVLAAEIDALIPVIGRVHPSALRALTSSWALLARTAGAPTIVGGLCQLEDLYKAFKPMSLPAGDVWLAHLETLGLIRPLGFASAGNRTWRELFVDGHPGYNTGGIEVEHFDAMLAQLASETEAMQLGAVSHDFAPDRVRTPFATEWLLRRGVGLAAPEMEDEYQKVRQILFSNQVWAMPTVSNFDGIDEAVAKLPNLSAFSQWWDQVPPFTFTQTGKVLANAEYARLRPGDEWEELELRL